MASTGPTSEWFTFSSLTGRVQVPRSHHVTTPTGRLAVRDTHPDDTDRPAVVLVHGWCADSLSNYHHAFGPLAAAGWRVVAPDLPGFGSSPLRARWTMDHAARAVSAVLDELGVTDAVWAGYSLGGPVTQTMTRLALGHPGTPARPTALVQLATAAHIVPSRTHRTALFVTERLWRTAGEALTTVLRVADTANPDTDVDTATLGTHGLRLLRSTNKRAIAQSGAALARYDSRPWVTALGSLESLSLVTTADQTVPPAAQLELAGLLGSAVTEVRADHRFCLQPAFGRHLTAMLEPLLP